MGALAKLFPAPAILTKIAIYVLVFALGGAVGSGWATKRALVRELQASADRQRQNHEQLIGWYAEKMKEIRLIRDQQQTADAAAYATLSKSKAESDQAAQQARASLRIALGEKQKLTETNDGLHKVNEILASEARTPDPGCVLSGRVRVALDAASGAIDPAIGGSPQTDPSNLPDGTGSQARALTCEQLARGYVALSEHDRMLTGWILAWQKWAFEALR